MESFDLREYPRVVSASVAACCRENGSAEPILAQLQKLAEDAELLLNKDSGDRSLIDCGPGCSTCCVVNVSTLFPEGIAIVRFIRQQETAWQQEVVSQLNQLWREIRGLDDDDRLFVRRSCAFLDENGSCGIYPVRPILCRSITSTSADGCHEALTGKLLGEESAVLMHQFQQRLYEALFSSVADGLEKSGLDGRSFQLTGLIRYLIRQPDGERKWLSGHQLSWKDLY